MPEAAALAKRLATSWRGDVLLATALLAWSLTYLCVTAAQGQSHWAALIFVVPYAAAVAIMRRWPVPAVVLASAALVAVWPLGLTWMTNGWLSLPLIWTALLLAYALGAGAGMWTGLAGIVLLAASLWIANGVFNPLVVAVTVGPWLVGRAMLSRRRLTGQLQARNAELAAEQELFAREAVRYERARIARELHDIVAHCLSVMVVQASAGQRVAGADPGIMAEAFEAVAEAAGQAEAEIGRLVELLSGAPSAGGSPRLEMVSELVRQASTAGLAVSCHFAGDDAAVPAAVSEAAYRVAQEALTNALKHAPGAPVTITIRVRGTAVEVSVVNEPPRQRPSGLERSGGGYGLTGMRQRVAACGGTLTTGPTPAGGWHVSALLPASPPSAEAASRAARERGGSASPPGG
jgi:signal transduction histidine kinase